MFERNQRNVPIFNSFSIKTKASRASMVSTSNLFVHNGHQFKILAWASFHAFALARFYFSLVLFGIPSEIGNGREILPHSRYNLRLQMTTWSYTDGMVKILCRTQNKLQIKSGQKSPHPRKRLKITKTGKIHIPQFKYSENKFVLLWGKEFWMLPVTGHCRMDRKVRWASLGYRHVRSVWGSAAEWRGLSKDAHWVSHSAGRGYCKGSGALCPPHR